MFSGTSVTLDGEPRYLDSHLAYQRAVLHAIRYPAKFGWPREQAYLLLGTASTDGRGLTVPHRRAGSHRVLFPRIDRH